MGNWYQRVCLNVITGYCKVSSLRACSAHTDVINRCQIEGTMFTRSDEYCVTFQMSNSHLGTSGTIVALIKHGIMKDFSKSVAIVSHIDHNEHVRSCLAQSSPTLASTSRLQLTYMLYLPSWRLAGTPEAKRFAADRCGWPH
jgi:hypothetical protein